MIIINNEQEMIDLGYKIGKKLIKGDNLLLIGDLGAGKTTLTKGIGLGLNVKKIINSPTYVIMKSYDGDIKINHFDFYRLNNSNIDYDLYDYINDNDVINIIEWPYNFDKVLPNKYYTININIDGNKRIVDLGELYEKINS